MEIASTPIAINRDRTVSLLVGKTCFSNQNSNDYSTHESINLFTDLSKTSTNKVWKKNLNDKTLEKEYANNCTPFYFQLSLQTQLLQNQKISPVY